jgi:hypothetical protein
MALASGQPCPAVPPFGGFERPVPQDRGRHRTATNPKDLGAPVGSTARQDFLAEGAT